MMSQYGALCPEGVLWPEAPPPDNCLSRCGSDEMCVRWSLDPPSSKYADGYFCAKTGLTPSPTAGPEPATPSPTAFPTTPSPTLPPVTTPRANLLANGSFEDFPLTETGNIDVYQPVVWKSLHGNYINVWKSGVAGVTLWSGDFFIELEVDGIYQDIPTVRGQKYFLTFYMRAMLSATDLGESVFVEWNGVVQNSNGFRMDKIHCDCRRFGWN